MKNKVFVYGTLQSGNSQRGLCQFGEEFAQFVGKAHTTESQFGMLNLGAFPGVIMGGEYNISGEVWEVTDDCMEQLDWIEGYPEFYSRRLTETTQGTAWMYYLKSPDRYGSEAVTTDTGVLQWA